MSKNRLKTMSQILIKAKIHLQLLMIRIQICSTLTTILPGRCTIDIWKSESKILELESSQKTRTSFSKCLASSITILRWTKAESDLAWWLLSRLSSNLMAPSISNQNQESGHILLSSLSLKITKVLWLTSSMRTALVTHFWQTSLWTSTMFRRWSSS